MKVLFCLFLATVATAELVIDEDSVFCNCDAPVPSVHSAFKAAFAECENAGYSEGQNGTATCVGVHVGFVKDNQVDFSASDLSELFNNSEVVTKCLVARRDSMKNRSGDFVWGGDIDWQQKDNELENILTCIHENVLRDCEQKLLSSLEKCSLPN